MTPHSTFFFAIYLFYSEQFDDRSALSGQSLKKMDMVDKEKTQIEMEALLEGYPFLKQLLHNVKQVLWLLDLSTNRILYVSPAFETVWGRSCESLYADPQTIIKNVHPEDRVKVLAGRPDENRKSSSQTYRILRPDGSLRWISADIFLLGDGFSENAYQFCVAQDITDQNKVDETLRQALDRSREQFTLSRRMSLARKPEVVLKTLMSAAEMRSAQRAFVLFFEHLPAGPSQEIEIIAAWSSVPYLTSLNPYESVSEASLFEELALLGLFHPSKPVIVKEVPKDERLTTAVRNMLLEGQIQTVAAFPMVALGNWLGCLLVFYPQEKHFETIALRHIKVLVDQATITLYNLQLLEIEAESRHEAERANEIKTKFLAMISHELRTPLTSIKGFTTTLLAEDVVWEPEEQHDFIQIIQQEANRLQELIDHLLDLSRLEAGMLPIALEPHSLREIIEDALPQFHTLTRGQTLTMHLPANLPPIFGDAKRIAQVLVNLVRNASTYAPQGTEINISASVRGGFVQVNVNDQGPGILPADHKRVFKAFQRGVDVENGPTQGAGLGLAICKGLVEAQGGRIWIKKKSTPGATISFTIPLVPLSTVANPIKEER
jgi:PAS domain S-box-containing protein